MNAPLQLALPNRPNNNIPKAIRRDIRDMLAQAGTLKRMRDFADMVQSEGPEAVAQRIEAKLAERGYQLETSELEMLETRIQNFARRLDAEKTDRPINTSAAVRAAEQG